MANRVTRRELVRATGAATLVSGFAGCSRNSGNGNGNGGNGESSGETPTIVHGSAPGAELTDYASMFRQSDHIVEEVMSNAGETYESEVSMFGGSPQIVSGMSGGECDLGVFSPPSAASAAIEETIDSGYSIVVPAKFQGVNFSDNLYTLADGGLQSPSDFEGVSVAVQAAGSAADVIARTSLQEAGVNLDEVTFREVGFGAMPSALREGRVDAALLIQPFVAMMGDDVTMVDDLRNPLGTYMELAIGGPNEFIENNSQAVHDWLQDHWEALQWWNDEANRDQVISIAAEITGLDEGLLDRIINTEKDYYHGDDGLLMNAHCYQIPIDPLYELDYIAEQVEIEPYIDNSYLPDAAAESGITCE